MQVRGVYIKVILGLLTLGVFMSCIIGCGRAGSGSIIEGLVSEYPAVKQGESTQIECITSTRYGSGFTYEWTATAGSILGTGSMVTWTAPDVCGTYSVTVTVVDESGVEASEELNIDVTKTG
jgi:hypothetical protein